MTFLAICFYTVAGINKNAGEEGCSNSQFSNIKTIFFMWSGKYLSFQL